MKIKEKINCILSDNKNVLSVLYNVAINAKSRIWEIIRNWERSYYILFLLLLVTIGFFIRFSYINMGLPYLFNWDEPFTVGAVIRIIQTGDFDPHFYSYPPVVIYILIPFFILNFFRLVELGSLRSLTDIVVGKWPGYLWTISHPSFYFVGRLVMALLMVFSIVLVYQIGKKYFDKKVGLLAALIFTFMGFKSMDVIFISPNIPVTFFVLLSLFMLSIYIERKLLRYIIATGFFSGLAVASKYNAFLIIVPAILGVLFYGNKKIRDIFIAIPATAVGFFIGCPYMIFSLSNYLNEMAIQLRQYKVCGFGPNPITPGLEHIRYYLGVFRDHLAEVFRSKGILSFPWIGIIAYAIADIKKFIIIFSFPLLYILYMSQQKANFSRNVVCIIPFVALFTAISFYYCYKIIVLILSFIGKNRLVRFKVNRELVYIMCFVALLMFFSPVRKIKEGYKYMKNFKETRTKAVEYVHNNFPDAKIGISKELRIHPFDLDKISNKIVFDTEDFSFIDIYRRKVAYVISSDKFVYSDRSRTDKMKILGSKFPEKNIIKTFGNGHMMMNIYSTNPRINIYKTGEIAIDEIDEKTIKEMEEGEINLENLWSNKPKIFGSKQLNMWWNCVIETCFYKCRKGNYSLNVFASGTIARKEWPILELKLLSFENNKIGEMAFVEAKEIGANEYKWYKYNFSLERDSIISLKLSFINDGADPDKGEDRNIFIKEVRLDYM